MNADFKNGKNEVRYKKYFQISISLFSNCNFMLNFHPS